ncbi:MAG: DUF1844 domain-containing protein [Planctomycetota bacterium]
MSENTDEPKIVIDDDWKSQVEKEKQQVAEPSESETPAERELPPANLAMLISTFYSQAMMSLGVMPHPETGEKSTDLSMAKHFIETLEMLQVKTKGNTDDEEEKMFDEVLHLLRMAFVGAKSGS